MFSDDEIHIKLPLAAVICYSFRSIMANNYEMKHNSVTINKQEAMNK